MTPYPYNLPNIESKPAVRHFALLRYYDIQFVEMSIDLTQPPFRLSRHRRTVSNHLDSMLKSSVSNAQSSRPSTASSDSSFTTAFSSLEGSPFRYYLPHISTFSSPVYTKNATFACNVAPNAYSRRIDQVGLFCHYIPDESTEQEDVYIDGLNTIGDAMRGGMEAQTAESKLLGALEAFSFADQLTPREVRSPLSFIGPHEFFYRPAIEVGDNVDLGSHTVGESMEIRKTVVVAVESGKVKRQRTKLTKDKHRKAQSVADVSEKVKKMLKKLHLGRKMP